MFTAETCSTRTAHGPAGMSLSSLAFGPIKGTGLAFGSRKHTRSCRCVLSRQRGGGISVLAHTNMLDSRTGRRIDADTRSLGLVTLRSRRLLMANLDELGALSEILCDVRETQTPAFVGNGSAQPTCGPDVDRRSVASAITLNSRYSSHRRGGYHVSACAGVLRTASLRPPKG
jgi:hypothetical protein